MKPPSFNLLAFLRRTKWPLKTVLNFSWWAILVIFLSMLVLDGIMFYQYGLGHAATPAGSAGPSIYRDVESLVKSAAAKLTERQSRFMATTTPEIADPFLQYRLTPNE